MGNELTGRLELVPDTDTLCTTANDLFGLAIPVLDHLAGHQRASSIGPLHGEREYKLGWIRRFALEGQHLRV